MTTWQSNLSLETSVLKILAAAPGFRSLTKLDLELELSTNTSDVAIKTVVKLIKDNSKLQHLKLCAAPDVDPQPRTLTKHWSTLLDLLGTNPPFRLRSFDLDGLTTSGTTTLDRIIRVHSRTLRRVVLSNTRFLRPNSLRAFYAAMAETRLEYLAMKGFLMHDRHWIVNSNFTCQYRPDEVLDWSESLDEAYIGWIDLTWDQADHRDWVIYNNEEGARDEYWMQDKLLEVVAMVDCGGIQE